MFTRINSKIRFINFFRSEKTYDHFSNEDNDEDDEDIMILNMSAGSSSITLSPKKHVFKGILNFFFSISYTIINDASQKKINSLACLANFQ